MTRKVAENNVGAAENNDGAAENNDGAAQRNTGVAGQTPVRGSGDGFSSGKLYIVIFQYSLTFDKLVRGKTSSAAERNSGVEGSNTGVEGQLLVCRSGDGFSSGKI